MTATNSRDRWIGTRVGLYLTVVARAGRDISDKQRFKVRCDCGAERIGATARARR